MGDLATMEVLHLDCQTTGASPAHGHLLEIGWCLARANALPSAIRHELVKLATGARIPPRVGRMTGIRQSDLEGAIEVRAAWEALVDAAEALAHRSAQAAAPAVIHYARFEESFLRDLHARFSPRTPYPLEPVCTLDIARRLYPDLPRRTLRAVAGFLGHDPGELRRSAGHVLATARVWPALVETLAAEYGIIDWPALLAWLAVPPPRRVARRFPLAPEKRAALVDGPGVYRFLRSDGSLLYVGKATSLKKRVATYFQPGARLSERALEMLSQARDLSFRETTTALEAALLESDEIKLCAPPYNVALRPRDRRLRFWVADLSSSQDAPDAAHRIGPILVPAPMLQVAALCRALAGRGPPPDAGTLLGIEGDRAPDAAIVASGLALFGTTHSVREPFAMLRLGSALWPAHRARRDLDPEDDDGPAEAMSWDAPAIARSLETLIVHAAQLVRRARWICRLSESTLGWTMAGRRRLLVIERGDVADRDTRPRDRRAPAPRHADRSLRERQGVVDLVAYDRLRVLTTELRRLVRDERDVRLRLGRGPGLGQDQLARLLGWL